MVGEAAVAERVGDDKDPGGGFDDGMGAERIAPRGFGDVETDPEFEPLPVGVDQGEEGDGNLTDLRCEEGDFVVVGLGRRIENTERAEQGDACGVVGGNGRRYHAVSGKSLSRRRAGATSHTVGEKIPL